MIHKIITAFEYSWCELEYCMYVWSYAICDTKLDYQVLNCISMSTRRMTRSHSTCFARCTHKRLFRIKSTINKNFCLEILIFIFDKLNDKICAFHSNNEFIAYIK